MPEKKAERLEKVLKEVARGNKKWADLNKHIDATTASQTKLRDKVVLSGLTNKRL